MRHAFVMCMAVAALGGCSQRNLRVDRAMVLPPMTATLDVRTDQQFLMAVPIEDPDPLFPAGARLRDALQVCVSFVVEDDGRVDGIAADRDSPGCAAPDDDRVQLFVRATLDALRGWRYFAAAICTFPEGVDPDSDPACDREDVRVDAVPIRLRYVFTFPEGRGGKVVRSTG